MDNHEHEHKLRGEKEMGKEQMPADWEMTDGELAKIADWAERQEATSQAPDWRKAYGAIRQGVDWVLRRRARARDEQIADAGKVIIEPAIRKQ